jgi:hypothetical protein
MHLIIIRVGRLIGQILPETVFFGSICEDDTLPLKKWHILQYFCCCIFFT